MCKVKYTRMDFVVYLHLFSERVFNKIGDAPFIIQEFTKQVSTYYDFNNF